MALVLVTRGSPTKQRKKKGMIRRVKVFIHQVHLRGFGVSCSSSNLVEALDGAFGITIEVRNVHLLGFVQFRFYTYFPSPFIAPTSTCICCASNVD